MTTPRIPAETAATLHDYQAKNMARYVERIARDLDELAEVVRRNGADLQRVPTPAGPDTYTQIATTIQHALFNTLANAPFGPMFEMAADADAALAVVEATTAN